MNYESFIVIFVNVLSSWQVRAQRKFASNGTSPSCSTPEVKSRSSSYTPRCLFPERKVATEDFLTFLCLRGTRYLIVIVITYCRHHFSLWLISQSINQSISQLINQLIW